MTKLFYGLSVNFWEVIPGSIVSFLEENFMSKFMIYWFQPHPYLMKQMPMHYHKRMLKDGKYHNADENLRNEIKSVSNTNNIG